MCARTALFAGSVENDRVTDMFHDFSRALCKDENNNYDDTKLGAMQV